MGLFIPLLNSETLFSKTLARFCQGIKLVGFLLPPVAMRLLVSFSHFWILVHFLLLFPPSYNVGLSWTVWPVPAYDCGVFPYQYSLLNIYFLWHYFCDWISCMLQDQDWCFTIHVRKMATVSSLGDMWSYSILPNQNFHQSGSNPLISMVDFH